MNADFIVVGAGIAGASVGYELALHGTTVVLEREAQPGYHATGRSAALYTENYGNAAIRRLARGSKPFLDDPPEGFGRPILTRRGAMVIARADQGEAFDEAVGFASTTGVEVRIVAGDELGAIHPGLNPDYVDRALYEPDAMDIDVNALHQGFLRGLKARGGTLVSDAEVTAARRIDGGWTVETAAGAYAAPVLVNAAGAWADELAKLARVAPLELVPKRRTAVTFDPPEGIAVDAWPMAVDVDEEFYFKPDAGRILASPADETPLPPQDVQPDEFDIAVCVERIERASVLRVRRLVSRWAGLRTFAPDKTPVIGFAPDAEGFLWLAGQGGYGIKTSPAMARIAAALALGETMPADLSAQGLGYADLAPERLR